MQGDYKVALRGDLTIYPKSGEEFDKIFGITNLIKRLVQTSVPRSITSVKGVIREVPVKESEDQLLELLSARYSSCMEARRATRAVDGKRVNTGTVILTFTDALPNSVLLGSRSFPVTKYVQRPHQCLKCLRLGHTSVHCKTILCSDTHRCKRCGGPHKDPCTALPSCINCKGSHESSDRRCPRYQLMVQAIQKSEEDRIPIEEAKRLLTNTYPRHSLSRHPVEPGQSPPPPVTVSGQASPHSDAPPSSALPAQV